MDINQHIKMKNYYKFAVLCILVLLSSCSLTGDEVGRLEINKVSSKDNLVIKETKITLKKGDKINFWSDMNVTYEGDVALRFRIEILKDNLPYGALEIDPFEKKISIGEIKTDMNGKVKWSFTGKNASLNIDEDGNYTFRGFLMANENSTLEINKAEIAIKE